MPMMTPVAMVAMVALPADMVADMVAVMVEPMAVSVEDMADIVEPTFRTAGR